MSVCVEEDITEKEFEPHHSIGIDVGIKDTITCSDGCKYRLTKNIERCEVKLKKLQQKLVRSEKGSKNIEKIIQKNPKSISENKKHKKEFYTYSNNKDYPRK